MNMEMVLKRILRLALPLMCLTLSGCRYLRFYNHIDEYESETEQGSIERLRTWGVDLPDDAVLVGKSYAKNPGTDGFYDSLFYCFEVDSGFSFEENLQSSDLESCANIFKTFFEAREEFREFKPDFEADMSCMVSVRLKSVSTTSDDDASRYSQIHLDEDINYYRRENVDGKMYVGKGYFILQSNDHDSKYLYSRL